MSEPGIQNRQSLVDKAFGAFEAKDKIGRSDIVPILKGIYFFFSLLRVPIFQEPPYCPITLVIKACAYGTNQILESGKTFRIDCDTVLVIA